MYKTISLFILWLVLALTIITVCCELLTYSSTIANIVGFFGIVALILGSIKTKCLTFINFKNEK